MTGSVNASPMARNLAVYHNIDLASIEGTGNFNRVVPGDVLIAAGIGIPTAVPLKKSEGDISTSNSVTPVVVLEGIVAMDGIQMAICKNMEKTLSVPVFRVSR